MKLKNLAFVALAFGGAYVLPDVAAAQGECPWGCHCTPIGGCACEQGWGAGSDCVINGGGCHEIICDEPGGFLFGPDGSAVALRDSTALLEWDQLQVVEWRAKIDGATAPPDFAVARHCSGVVVGRFYTREEAARVRTRHQKLLI